MFVICYSNFSYIKSFIMGNKEILEQEIKITENKIDDLKLQDKVDYKSLKELLSKLEKLKYKLFYS